MKRDDLPAALCFFGLPLVAVSVAAFRGYTLAPAGSSPLVWALGAALFGAAFLGVMIAASGNDMTDFAVNSLIVIFLFVLLLPVFQRAKINAQKRASRAALRQKKQLPPSPKPKTRAVN